ncbi:MAG: hypothetical protein RML36_12755 [Anaerolineae bacterium]|nr:hypothetical protein [Anaerolineae bacterium]MDW8100342.1 hypothetical protein [Anaerolineae bacterium]
MARPVFAAYSTWGMHDELGDNVVLDESLVLRALDALERWRAFGMAPEYFLIDYGWADPELGYRHFDRRRWPEGPDRMLRRIREAGMLPGLWYAVNGGHMQVPRWEPSRSSASWHFSLLDGPFYDELSDGVMHAAEVWGIRFFKFDFADFAAGVPDDSRLFEVRYTLSVERFVDLVARLKRSVPEVITIAHCGFARYDPAGRLGPGVPPLAADPGMLEIIDGFFSGDPQVADLPATALCRSSDLYQDIQVRRLMACGFPLNRIEDHGVLCGLTNTCLRRGREGLRRSHIAQLARSGRRDLFYGDPTLPTDADLAGMAAARRLFFDAWSRGLECAALGPEPGSGPWHGWLTGGGRRGLAWIVNPHLEPCTLHLPIVNLARAEVLFYEGDRPALQTQPDELVLRLGPEQAALIGLGAYADPQWVMPPDDTVRLPRHVELINLAWQPARQGMTATLPAALPEDAELMVIAYARDGPPNAPGPFPALRVAKQSDRDGVAEPESHRLLSITVEGCPHHAQVPGVSVWNGTSWVLRRFARPSPGAAIVIRSLINPPCRLRAEAWAVRW